MAEIGCNWARIGPSKSSQSLSNAHKWAVVVHDNEFNKQTIHTFQGSRSSRKHFKTLSLDELRSLDFNLFSDLKYSEEDHEDANEHIEKVLEIVDLFHILNITIDQVMLRAFLMSLTRAEEILFYNGLGIPTRQILDLRGAIPSKTTADAKDPIITKNAHSKKKGKPLKKLTTCNLVDLFKEGDIEQQLWDSIKGTMQILHTKNEGNLWKIG
ncbi:hypothetical protein Tco_0956646 [Tanacetum coccineum]